MRTMIALFLLASISAAMAQTPDTSFLQKAISSLQTQRNNAMDAAAAAEARAATAQEDLTKAQARIKELEDAKKADASTPPTK